MTEPTDPAAGPEGPVQGTLDGGEGQGAPGRGVALTAVAFVIGVLVLASIGHLGPRSTASASPTTTAAPATTTTVPLATHAPSSVIVQVNNGTGTGLLAAAMKAKLAPSGWDILAPTDTTTPVSTSAVYYVPGYQGDARAIASAAGISSGAVQPLNSSVPVASSNAEVIVVIGPDLSSSGSGGGGSGTSSSGTSASNG